MTCFFSDVSVKDFDAVSAWCQEQGVTLVVVGPEDPLAGGIADHLAKKGGLPWLLALLQSHLIISFLGGEGGLVLVG